MQGLNQIAKAIEAIDRIIMEMEEQIKKNEKILGYKQDQE
jgi:hypothetical protein